MSRYGEFADEVRAVVEQMRAIPEPPAEVVEAAKAIPCTCTRLDVDLYDTTGCEACGPSLERFYDGFIRAQYMTDEQIEQELSATSRVADEDCGGASLGGSDVAF